MAKSQCDSEKERRWRGMVSAKQASGLSIREYGRQKLPVNLKWVTEVVDMPEVVKTATVDTQVKIGDEVSEKLDYTPSNLFLRQIVRQKYVAHFADKSDELPCHPKPRNNAD